MNTTQRNRFVTWLTAIALLAASVTRAASSESPSTKYFTIRVVDRQTGRGVPLVELRTTNSIRYFTDSNGIVAFHEPGLMDREVFFFVESHGYELPKDGFGSRGTRLRTTPGKEATVKIDRLNLAERLYRVTGQGIYRDSILAGRPVPLKNPVLNGQVMGQDSVFTCLYQGRLFWMWGDTSRPSYPLGNFAMSGAHSDLPGQIVERGAVARLVTSDVGRPTKRASQPQPFADPEAPPRPPGLDPALGVDLEYFVDESGFSRKMAPLKEPGLVWLDGLMTVPDPQGRERMVAKFARLKGLGEVLERGLVVFNDTTNTFEPLVRPGLEFLPYRNTGHAFPVEVMGQPLRQAQGRLYYYFTAPSPMGVRMRVPAQWDAIIDASQYEVLTALTSEDGGPFGVPPSGGSESLAAQPAPPPGTAEERRKAGLFDPRKRGTPNESSVVRPAVSPSSVVRRLSSEPRWVGFGDVLATLGTDKTAVIEALEAEAKGVQVYDVESGRAVTPHNGTVYFNGYRKRWVGIFGQLYGESSALGEIWYAEADTPVGPWAYARKVVTHNKYSFYNPKHHPLFDQDGGRTIYFEGTYTWTFSGSEDRATPRYDYNQIMYRLNLDDPRLLLPTPVYRVRDGQERTEENGDGRRGLVSRARAPASEGGTPSTQQGRDGRDTKGRSVLPSDLPAFSPSQLLPGSAVARTDQWKSVDSVAFYAIEPDRPADGLIPVYANKAWRGRPALGRTSRDSSLTEGVPPAAEQGRDGLGTQGRDALATDDRAVRLTTQPDASARPLFLALPAAGDPSENPCIVPLYEYRHGGSGRYLYSTDSQLRQEGWERTEGPLCRVWKTPPGPPLLDPQARPSSTP